MRMDKDDLVSLSRKKVDLICYLIGQEASQSIRYLQLLMPNCMEAESENVNI